MGKAIVISVGDQSRRSEVPPDRLGISDGATPLQQRLQNIGSHLTKWGLYGAIAILAVLIINFFIVLFASDNPTFGNNLYKLINYLTLAIVIIVVAVPEGLPLSIGIALAYSTKKMKQHKILVKNLASTEVMGQVEEIVTGKTGTITSEDMSVAEWFAFGKRTENKLLNTLTGSDFN